MTSNKRTTRKTTAKAEEKDVMKVITTPADEKQIFIYIGPTLKDRSLVRNSIFKNGKPNIAGITDNHPIINELFVPIANHQEKLKEINTKGSILNTAYSVIEGV